MKWLMKTVFKLGILVSLVMVVLFGFGYLLSIGGKAAMASIAEIKETGSQLMTQQQIVDARPASNPCYHSGKGGRVWYLEYKDQAQVDLECQKFESVRLAPVGMEAQAKHVWCTAQVVVGAFVDVPTCINYKSDQASVVAERATVARSQNDFCAQGKPRWWKFNKRSKYKHRCT